MGDSSRSVVVPHLGAGRRTTKTRASELSGAGAESSAKLGEPTSASNERDDDAGRNQEDDKVDQPKRRLPDGEGTDTSERRR